ncbi:hypothetical protein [Neobacillus sp. FSL H8-0543]|uniref:hypothetical protein n=1 Tax=Neobacillus sp. FSL H8-0543 TaxID=2954672 RepID=UPI003158371A
MRKRRNFIPFLILFFIHTGLLGYAFYKKENKKQLFTLLMSNIGLAYLFEFFVLNLFTAYTYKPGILKNAHLDNIFGAILSQAIFVPFTAVFLTARKVGWIGKLLSGVYFFLVEILFLKLGIFKRNWWKTVYTLIFTPFYFFISDYWELMLRKKIPIIRYLSLFLMIMVTEANLLFIFAVKRKLRFGLGRYHSWTEHFILVPLYAISLSLFATWSFMKKNSWTVRLRVQLFTIGLNKLFEKTGLVKSGLGLFELINIHFLIVYLYGKYSVWALDGLKKGEEEQLEEQ